MTLEALDIFDPSSYPTRRDEDWKYSDLSRVLRAVPNRILPSEYHVSPGDELRPPYPRYEAFNDNNTSSGLQSVPEKSVGDIWFKHYQYSMPGTEAGFQGADRLTLRAGESLTLFETYAGSTPYVANTWREFVLGEGAHLVRVVLLNEPEDAISIRRSTVITAPGATFKQYVFSTGAKFQRFETHVEHAGHGASVELHGAYLLKDKAHFDLTTRVNHAQPDGQTQQLIKGLVKDSATAVFQGRIKVERGADGTDARMRHQALMLNDGAHVRAKPELEIYADDVQCAHGNTIGAMDEAALFFCQSRGMDEATARQLLMQAFVTPVADQIEDEELRAKVLEFLEKASEAFYAV